MLEASQFLISNYRTEPQGQRQHGATKLENRVSTCRKMKLDPGLSPHTKIFSKWIKDFNISSTNLKMLKENRENTLRYTQRLRFPEKNSNSLRNNFKNFKN